MTTCLSRSNLRNFLARIRLRLMDRSEGDSSHILTRDDLTLDLRTQRVKVGDKWRDVSRREMGLLETLMRNPGEVMSRAQLLSKVWGMDFDPGSNVVDVYIRTLRKKIGSERVETVSWCWLPIEVISFA